MKARLAVAIAAMLAATIPFPVQAQDDEDGPGRGVARISLINGDVSVRRGDTGEFVAAAINSPVVVADRVVTGVNSRAEVQLDYANYMRLAGESEIRLSQLENRRYQLQVARGMVTYNVLRDSDADVEISTPTVSLRPVKRGIYRIEVKPDDTTEVTVRSGELEVFTPQGSERLKSGRTMMARGTQDNPEVRVLAAAGRDSWDEWNEYRNRDLERAHENSYRYVSRDVYGAEDLYGHGDWIYSAPYGYVWAPRVSVGWAPYRYGRWTWVDWYGWSWVSYDPWGWAPYHYGRWFYAGNRWCWWPGGLTGRHYWRPALVAWVGWGGGGVGIGFGRVGWIPLAPYERFHPWYGNRYYGGYRNRTYIDNSVNIVNNVNIYNTYRNSRVNNGITGVDGADFGRGGRQRYESFNSRDLNQASLVRGQVPYAPDRDSVRFTDRETRITRASNDNQRFYSRSAPAKVDRVSFEDQRRGMEQVSRRTFGESGERVARGGEGGGVTRGAEAGERMTRGSEANAGSRQAEGFTRGGESGGRSAVAADSGRGSSSDSSGWRRFGEPSGRSAESGRAADAGRSAVDRGVESRGGRGSGDGSVFRGQESRGSEGFQRGADTGASQESGGWRRLGSSGGRSADTGGSRQSEFGSRGSSDGGARDSGSRDSGSRDSGARDSGARESRGVDVGGRSASSDSNGWRRFGDPGSTGSQRGSDRTGSYSDRSSGGGRGSDGISSRSSDSFGGRSIDRGSSREQQRYESPRISPPVVRERSSGSYGGRSEQRSSPNYTPRSSGGDYGGRSSGGSYGGRSSGPSFGGGGRSGGGDFGGRSSGPSFGGGGRSSGGGSSPSMGGGGRSSGGGGRGGRNQ